MDLEATLGQHELPQPVKDQCDRQPWRPKNQLPLVSVSQDIWLPPLRPVTANFSRLSSPPQADGGEVVQLSQRPGALSKPQTWSIWYKDVIEPCVFAPARVVEEMAEALPMCLWGEGRQQSGASPLQNKPNKRCLKMVFFFTRRTAAVPDKSTNEGQ